MSGKETSQDRDRELIQKAFRSRTGTTETILASQLIRANAATDGIKKVKILCEAALLAASTDKKAKIDTSTIEDLYVVACAFSAAIKQGKDGMMIPFGFPESPENHKRFIESWQKIKWRFWIMKCRLAQKITVPNFEVYLNQEKAWKKQKETNDYVLREFKKLPDHEQFFDVTASGALTIASFLAMQNEFITYALNKLIPAQISVSKIVSPSAYREAYSLYNKEEDEDLKHENHLE